MKSFSQRKGYTPVSELIQSESMNTELRNALWNTLEFRLWSSSGFMSNGYGQPRIQHFSRALWAFHFKEPIDTIPSLPYLIMNEIREHYYECEWFEVYDFIEFVANYLSDYSQDEIYDYLNLSLESELSAYRFVDGQLADIVSKQEIEMLEEALEDTQFKGASSHLQRALELYSDRKNPDYRNSIKESISAVESMAKIVTNNPKAMLSDALKAIEKNGQLHKALKDGFEKLYAYTSDANGIRHAMLDEDNLNADDARYFLLSCTSFVNYLKSKV